MTIDPKTVQERLDRHLERQPRIHSTAYVAPGAVVLGDVTLEENSSVWFQCTLRGDINSIRVGPGTNIQDNSVLHLDDDFGCVLGEYVTVGHSAIVHACTVGNEVLVGMGSIILDGVEIGDRSIIGAGALVTMGKKIPPGSLVLGSPAEVARELSLEEQRGLKKWAEKYVENAKRYRAREAAAGDSGV